MEFIRFLEEISKSDIHIAGGKGASLGEMIKAGFPVPYGFVVLASAFDKFLKETDINVEIFAQLNKVDLKRTDTVDDASEVLRNLILKYQMPKDIKREILKAFENLKARYVAVRSSATAEDSKIASWAGELESYLGITKKNLIKAVQKCWASLFTPRAIFYRLEKKLDGENVSVAVVVQKLIEAEVAGVCFTVHPVTKDKNQIVIEAGYGLGEAVVGGKVTPDTYVIDKTKLKRGNLKTIILDKNVNEQTIEIKRVGNKTKEVKIPKLKAKKQCLSDKEIVKLARICQKIEKYFNFPCDIEWCFEKGKFYIVQSRPITTL